MKKISLETAKDIIRDDFSNPINKGNVLDVGSVLIIFY
jgi:hypothetical protein